MGCLSKCLKQLLVISVLVSNVSFVFALSFSLESTPVPSTRRDMLVSSSTALATVGGILICPPDAVAIPESDNGNGNGLAAKLAKRDPALLRNSVFNIPPSAQVYPAFCRGSWDVTSKFNGYIFPSDKIPKSKLTNDFVVPGFQKCSIAALSDVGKEEAKFVMNIDETTGLEDRNFNLAKAIDGYLGYKAVAEVIHDSKANPNRLSVVFVEYKTINAERIELFCNARESESYQKDGMEVFVCSEYMRQVTFGGGPNIGVARQVVGNYAHFWTWKKQDENHLTGNVLTAAYLDPQDPLFFDEPSKPVAIYSNTLTASRRP